VVSTPPAAPSFCARAAAKISATDNFFFSAISAPRRFPATISRPRPPGQLCFGEAKTVQKHRFPTSLEGS
jgi:hypothetical protein